MRPTILTQLPPPANWEVFEDLCHSLFAELWADRRTQKHGRRGQAQCGVDIYGQPKGELGYCGVQCKGKDRYTNRQPTPEELRREVEKAKSFTPALKSFILATTAQRDRKIQELARELSEENAALGLFTVEVKSWDDINDDLHRCKGVLERYYSVQAGTLRQNIHRLTTTDPEVFGREGELEALNQAWADPDTNVVVLQGVGGMGKSAVIRRWLADVARRDYDGVRLVLAHSFAAPVEGRLASADEFINAALVWLGAPEFVASAPERKGQELAALIRRERSLLILDGIETLLRPTSTHHSEIVDSALRVLISEIAGHNPGLCIITTRLPIGELASYQEPVVRTIPIGSLPRDSSVSLLRKLGVDGSEQELSDACREYYDHPLSLRLLGSYLRNACRGDVRQRSTIRLLDEDEEHRGQANRMMSAYAERYRGRAELQLLRALSLIDRPVGSDILKAVLEPPSIEGLTDTLCSLDRREFLRKITGLRDAELILPRSQESPEALDVHPLIREYFARDLRSQHPVAWKEAHRRLFRTLTSPAQQPVNQDHALTLFQGVIHGCRAGLAEEAFLTVYWPCIQNRYRYYSTDRFGLFGTNVSALAHFFEKGWHQPASGISPKTLATVLNLIGFSLRALGRFEDSFEPSELAIMEYKKLQDWRDAAGAASSLGYAFLWSGKFARAIETFDEGVELADRSKHVLTRTRSRTALGDACHHAGRFDEARRLFEEAEEIQRTDTPNQPQLESVQSYRYCDYLLTEGQAEISLRRSRAALAGALNRDARPFEIGLHHLIMGRSYLKLDELTPALMAADEAVTHIERSKRLDSLSLALLGRAGVYRELGYWDSALRDVAEAHQLSRWGGTKLYQADCSLEWARISLAQGDLATAQEHLRTGRASVEHIGYGRRRPEIHLIEAGIARLEDAR